MRKGLIIDSVLEEHGIKADYSGCIVRVSICCCSRHRSTSSVSTVESHPHPLSQLETLSAQDELCAIAWLALRPTQAF